MKGGDDDMEVDITAQQDNESIRTKSDQFMEEQNELDYEHVPNQEPLHVQENSTPIKYASNLISTCAKPIQLV